MSAEDEPQALGDLRFRSLLVAVDGSSSSELALSEAVRAARFDNAAVTILTVEPDIASEAFRWSSGGVPSAGSLQDSARDDAEKTIREAVARIPEDIPVTKIHRFGKAGPEIVAQSEEGDYDAILLGARGVGRVGSLLGSVSQYVMHHAETPVIVARA